MFDSRGVTTSVDAAFQRYTARTDGKEKIADCVGRIADARGYTSLLDLGSGDGALTRLLRPHFGEVVAVEKDPAFRGALKRIEGAEVVISRMEDFSSCRKFDLALLAYSFSGIPAEQRARCLDSVRRMLTERGALLVVTFMDGCAWDRFAERIYRDLGITRQGGAKWHLAELERCNRVGSIIETVETAIWDNNAAELAETLSYFFRKNIDTYRARMLGEYLPILEEYTEILPGGQVKLPVVEAVLEVQ